MFNPSTARSNSCDLVTGQNLNLFKVAPFFEEWKMQILTSKSVHGYFGK